jgi:hypothetical protein
MPPESFDDDEAASGYGPDSFEYNSKEEGGGGGCQGTDIVGKKKFPTSKNK